LSPIRHQKMVCFWGVLRYVVCGAKGFRLLTSKLTRRHPTPTASAGRSSYEHAPLSSVYSVPES
jgi:hypothetical protein